ncbi:TMEM175 family protein [Novosphingobium soli]|uniref:TMEM175 family protein n=1 Tax=Novosphingobium soli TaxID=574956 RepID=A0ABV6CXV0_9SPHN
MDAQATVPEAVPGVAPGEAPAGAKFALERVVFFSDAVFAIAITLLVLEIEVPHLPHDAPPHRYWEALYELVPSFLAFLLSFLVIGRFWLSHHQIFGRVKRFDVRLIWPNMLYLLSIGFMPFTTAFMAAGRNTFVPALCYNLNLLVAGLLVWLLMYRVEKLDLAAPSPDQGQTGSPSVVAAALLSIALTFVIPALSQFGMVTIPLWRRLFRRRSAA